MVAREVLEYYVRLRLCRKNVEEYFEKRPFRNLSHEGKYYLISAIHTYAAQLNSIKTLPYPQSQMYMNNLYLNNYLT